MKYIVMGVCGCGKSHIGAAFATANGSIYIDGDDLHPTANIAKMARGEPLTDDDRMPWLDLVGNALADAGDGAVIGCSALRRVYRDRIRNAVAGPVTFLHLTGNRDVIAARLASRAGHFMPPALLDSQLAVLEPPTPDEAAICVDIDQPPDVIVVELLTKTMEREL